MEKTFLAHVIRGKKKDTMGVVVPDAVVEAFGKGKRPPVVVRIGSHSYQTTVARMGGQYLVGIAKEHRLFAGLSGDEPEVEVTLQLDTKPRTVAVPTDLADALESEGLREAFERLPPSGRKEWVRQVESAKREDTRIRRIQKALEAAKKRA